MSTFLINCYGCGKDFTWTEPSLEDNWYDEVSPIPAYHSESCKERTRVRKLRRFMKDAKKRCPRRDKMQFNDYVSASKYVRNKYGTKQGDREIVDGLVFTIGAYRCECGLIHLGRRVAKIIENTENLQSSQTADNTITDTKGENK